MAQLTFDIPKVDEKATRKEVKNAFNLYHDYKAALETMFQVRGLWKHFRGSGPSGHTTAHYIRNDADGIHGSSKRLPAIKQFENAMEDLQRQQEQVDRQREKIEVMETFIEAVDKAVESLPRFEREVMERTLMVNKYARLKDSLIWPAMGLTKNVFYEHKEKAMLRIAFALRIEVYEKPLGTAA